MACEPAVRTYGMSANLRNKWRILLTVLLLMPLAIKAQYSGYVGDYFTIPDPPDRYGYTAMNATFGSSSPALYVDSYGFVEIRSYFTGTETVTCNFLYVKKEGYGTIPGSVYYTVTCIPRYIYGLPSSITMEVGEQKTLNWTFSPSSASAQIDWVSNNYNVVTVSSNGTLSAKAPGNATITAQSNSGPNETIFVTVNENKKISLFATPSSGKVIEGTVVKLSSNKSGTDIYYTQDGSTPSRNSIAYTSEGITIRESCTLKAIGYKDGYETSPILTEKYTAVPHISPTSITISTGSKSIGVGETVDATYTLIPANANTDTDVTWSSDDSSIASISQAGKITGIKTGATFIHATTGNGKTDSYKIAVISTGRSKVFDDGLGAIDIVAGAACSYVVKDDGTLWAFGANGLGQLGDGTIDVDRTKPVRITDGVSSVKNGDSNVFFLKNDKSLWGCGYNYYGQLGQGYTNNWETKPVKISDDVISVGAHWDSHYTRFGKIDHSVWQCGGYFDKQTTPIQIKDSSDSIAVVVQGSSHQLYIKTDGTLWTEGYNDRGQLANGTTSKDSTPFAIVMDSVATAASGMGNSFIVRTDGTLWVCGYNDYGVLGTGNKKDSQIVPVMVMDSVAMVSAGWYSTFIVRTDGTLWGCGYNWYGELGDGTTTQYLSPVKLMDGVYRASVGNTHSLILKTDGSVWSCGRNDHGQLGNGTKTNRLTPVCILNSTKQAEVLSITVSESEKIVKEGDSFKLNYSYTPTRVEADVNWTSDDPLIASVDATTGIVTAIKEGTTYINVTTSNGKIDWCKVTVLYVPKSHSIKTSTAGYATFYDSRSAYILPNGTTASIVENVSNNKLTYNSLNSNIIPVGTAVILTNNSKTAGSYTLTPTNSDNVYNGTNLLRGSDDAQMTTGDGYHYKLSYGMPGTSWSDVFGWYWGADNGGSFMTEGHKAWLVVPKSAASTRGFTVDGETTGIATIEQIEKEPVYYDLQGRRISKPTVKGVYIKNGKKVMVK